MRKIVLVLLVLISGNAIAQQAAINAYTNKPLTTDGTGKIYLGREIARVMGFDGAEWLERNNRDEEENTKRAIANLPVTAASAVADIGAGTGYYTFRIAAKVPKGKVYAVEIQDDAISFLNKRAAQLKISNVTVIKGGERSPNLPDNSVDLAMMVDVYHELLYPAEMLQAIRRSLKPGGKLLLLEYRAEDPEVNIKALHKMSVAQVNKELNANGFRLVANKKFLPMQHYLIYQKD